MRIESINQNFPASCGKPLTVSILRGFFMVAFDSGWHVVFNQDGREVLRVKPENFAERATLKMKISLGFIR
jgi:hypothetical protein